ncbi:adenosylcobinamide-GDP ribazoletransferase [Maridesulfovibrio ferrireducens]|uniref:adenosylcobinamide-GDP ribazoletransferase n=1 Tax=Maridesulfovibrio ferrireducens TaxID=246191 RepID=UPI001A279346|nr:adenosylcobinamide-GDP ribazoletransferase [Maridesulfovibrio ferrireducens]MBI9112986.1 adenosylcobinamide-GDP ribazoletransferase [Maridesulfovibrio ferrireducens]
MRIGIVRDFLITLGFMTRIGPILDIEPEDLRRTVKWMPFCGLALGAVIILPFYLGLFAGKFWIQAWLTLAASIYLTRGLHFDGIADIADGAGPFPDPDKFWRIIKDSCSGVFGILVLIVMLTGQLIGFYYVFEAGALGAVLWVFVVGRLGNSVMCMAGKSFARPGQGSLFMCGADNFSIAFAFVTTVVVGIFAVDINTQILTYLLAALCILFLYRLAKKVNGANGDFLGGAVVLSETAALLAFVACH